jgi:hypothetical protein
MTWAIPSGVRNTITKTAVAGVLIALPTAALSVRAYATPDLVSTPNTPAVLPAPPPADPPTDAPPPPAPPRQNYEYYNPNDANDWWYNGSADGGGGGGGG